MPPAAHPRFRRGGRKEKLPPRDLAGSAAEAQLDADRFRDELRRREYAARINRHISSVDESGVPGTPTFVVNGRPEMNDYDRPDQP